MRGLEETTSKEERELKLGRAGEVSERLAWGRVLRTAPPHAVERAKNAKFDFEDGSTAMHKLGRFRNRRLREAVTVTPITIGHW